MIEFYYLCDAGYINGEEFNLLLLTEFKGITLVNGGMCYNHLPLNNFST